MYQYGELIDSGFDPQKNNVYEAFTEYFNNPGLTKIKDVKEFSMYAVRIHAMLGNAQRYLIVFVPRDVRVKGSKENLENLKWVSLQTRTLEEIYHVSTHMYMAKKQPPLNQKISITSQDEKQSSYIAEKFPLTITLLHTKKNNVYQYHPTGSIVSAIETYQTIINFKE